jgi:16S rRNA (guanine527-N7)-methyltransferase
VEVGAVADVHQPQIGAATTKVDDPLDDDPRVAAYFGDAWPVVGAFAGLLREHGVVRGLVGPNELGRLWERHLLNSAAAAALLPSEGTLVDLGSGAGLPGVVLAALRPGVHVVLLEPMERRTDWLRFVVDELGLANAEVVRGRAEEVAGTLLADAVTARAVSSVENLYRWSAPLVRAGGGLFALKGAKAAEEVVAARRVAVRTGWSEVRVVEASSLPDVGVTRVVCAVRAGGARRVR